MRDESICHALGLLNAGVSSELIVRPGAVHGFDLLAVGTPLHARTPDDRHRVIATL